MGLLTAEVNPAKVITFFRFLSDRLGEKPIELTVEANGKKVTVKTHGREGIKDLMELAKNF